MRSLEERIAEINHRSEMIFRKRKHRRKRVLVACGTLILCICVGAAAVIQRSNTKDGWSEAVYESDGAVGGIDQETGFAGFVEVSNSDGMQRFASIEAVDEITKLIDRIVTVSESGNLEYSFGMGDVLCGTSASGASGCAVTITQSDGLVRKYHLTELLLADEITGEEYPLTKEEAQELKALLGLPLE